MLKLPSPSRMMCHWLMRVAPSVLLAAPCASAELPAPAPSVNQPGSNVAAVPGRHSDESAGPAAPQLDAPPAGETAVADDRERATLTTSLVTPIFGAYYLEANVRLADAWGLLVNSSYLVLDNADWHTTTGSLGAGVSYSWSGRALRGWYSVVVGEVLFSSWEHEPSDQTAAIVLGYSAIALTGYRFIWDAGPVVDLGAGFVGLHFPSARVDVDGETVRSKAMTKYYPAVKVAVGWAF